MRVMKVILGSKRDKNGQVGVGEGSKMRDKPNSFVRAFPKSRDKGGSPNGYVKVPGLDASI